MIKVDLTNFNKEEVKKIFSEYQLKVNDIHDSIHKKTCLGANMLGWMEYPFNYDVNEIKQLKNLASLWRNNSKIKTIVVLGIGGSYIGLKAAIDMCLPVFNRDKEIIFVYNLSAPYITSLMQKLKNQDFYLVAISKSGTTMETGVAFRIFYELIINSIGEVNAKERIVCITDKENGTMRQIVSANNLYSFSIPNDVGGRFSSITPVGLFVMAYMGLDVDQILCGCQTALKDTQNPDITVNTAYQYALVRYHAYKKMNKSLEVFGVYEPQLFFFSEHWKQLMGESEGKQHKGLYPTNCLFTTDLHSLGQFLQEGSPVFFETVLHVNNVSDDKVIKSFLNDMDGLGFINDKSIDYLNKVAESSTIDAHHLDGGVDVVKIIIDKTDAYHFGYLYSWISKVVAMSALFLEVNPFDQPGVEAYKKRMFSTLKKDF